MAYCTLADLLDRYGVALLLAVSDRGDVAPTEPDADLVARAIADADARIDSFLFARYALPLADVPPVLKDISQRIAIYNAHGQVASEKITADHRDALKDLENIGKGIMRLDVAGAEPASSGGSEVLTNEPERPLTAESLRGYI